jgi:hypothetical protein
VTLRTCTERTAGTREAWLEKLNLTEGEFDGLVSARVFRQQPGSNVYQLEFVGVAMTSRGSIAVAPRVPGAASYSFAAILRLLRRYFLRSAARAPYESAAADLHFRDDRVVREFDAYLALLSWYWEHGLYRQETRAVSTAGGRPDWRRTFARSPVLISDGRVLYAQPVGTRRAYNPSLVGSLQLHFLRELSGRFGYSPPPDIETEAHWSLPLEVDPSTEAGAQMLASRIQAERRSVFRGDRLVLMDTLLALLGTAGLDGPQGMRLYGTTAFYMVWEDACRHYFSSDEFLEISELAQPRWGLRASDGSWSTASGGEQRPDIALHVGNVRALLDAKYYYPFPASRPGWADIVKQIYYQESLPAQEGEVVNCFLMPGSAAERFTYAGYVKVDGKGAKTFPAVEAWLLNSLHVLDTYASGDALQPPILGEFLRHREGMAEVPSEAPANIGL